MKRQKDNYDLPVNGEDSDRAGPSGNSTPELDDDSARVVYRRTDLPDSTKPTTIPQRTSVWRKELSPALVPLIVGFLLLLILIGVLGFLSMRRMEQVGRNVLDLEEQHNARSGLILKVRLAVTKLNNEARARSESDARRELRPPFEFPLSRARSEVRDWLKQLDSPPLNTDPAWTTFRNDLKDYVELTDDLRRYSLEGFTKFKVVDTELNDLSTQANEQQIEVVQKSDQIQRNAAQSIRTWSVIALLFGGVITLGTIWEVQRRFSEMRRSVEEARRERTFTSQLMEGMVSAVAAVDEHDRIRSANAAFFKIFPRATIGASLYEKFASDDAMKMLEAATATRVDHASYRGRWVCAPQSAAGGELVFDVYSSPLQLDGSHGQILTLVDVTEAAESERTLRRQESLAAVGQATAQVAHEIRNPLGSIRLGVSMLRDSISDEEGLNTIELVERGINHLNKLVVDVAQFSRRKALEQSQVDLHDLVNHSLHLVADKIKEKQANIVRKFTSEKIVGHWDPDQLSQVVVNLIANAVDAGPKSSTVTISTLVVHLGSADDDEEDGVRRRRARLSIADEGSGMDQATLDRIFEPFFSTKKRGTGLGLAIVKQIVEQHEGTISVSSEVGKGTRFVIDLPL